MGTFIFRVLSDDAKSVKQNMKIQQGKTEAYNFTNLTTESSDFTK